MKNWMFTSLLFLLVAAGLSSCQKRRLTGDGPSITESRDHQGFSRVQLQVPADLFYSQSAEYKVEITAQQNILNELETLVMSGSDLILRMRDNRNLGSHERIRVIVSSPDIHRLVIKGSGFIGVSQPLQVDDIELMINGSGKIDLSQLTAWGLECNITGSGEIDVQNGTSDWAKARIDGSGDINLLDFVAQQGEARINGSGSIRMHIIDNLAAHIAGSGEIRYRGNPKVNSTISGSGKVVRY